jgi:hypothetical protein
LETLRSIARVAGLRPQVVPDGIIVVGNRDFDLGQFFAFAMELK